MEHLNYYFEDQTNKNYEELFKLTSSLYKYLSKKLNLKDPNLSCTIVDDKTIHQINKEYRKIDRPTDVISFAYNDYNEGEEEPFIDLGELVISLDTAFKQALEYNHPVEREIAFLFIHGFLHLNGYDHIKQEDAEKMFALQNELLNNFEYDYVDLNK